MYRSAKAAMEQVNHDLIDAGRTLGMSEKRIFFTVILPEAMPGIISGGVLSFARGLGEFGATAMLAGNIVGKTRTLPIAVYSEVMSGNYDNAGVYVFIIVVICLIAVVGVNIYQYSLKKKKEFLDEIRSCNFLKKLAEYDLDVCFESHEDRLGLMGPSGSGKSMVLKCIAGIITPDAGRIVLDDEVLFDSNLKINISPQKRKIGYMFQNYALFDHMNVYQNIAAPLKAHHEDKQVIKEKVQQIMEDFQIDDLQKRYPRQLSGGQKQRVALARLLVYDTKLVLLDEPFSALDETLKEQLLNETKKKTY